MKKAHLTTYYTNFLTSNWPYFYQLFSRFYNLLRMELCPYIYEYLRPYLWMFINQSLIDSALKSNEDFIANMLLESDVY